jgi:hypothetical protein
MDTLERDRLTEVSSGRRNGGFVPAEARDEEVVVRAPAGVVE